MRVERAGNQNTLGFIRMDKIIHVNTFARNNAHGIAIGDSFAEGGEIGNHIANALIAAKRMSETGLHLIKYQQSAVFVAKTAKALQITAHWFHDADIL